MPQQVLDVYIALDAAIREGVLIHRSERRDKEFHFQDWFAERLNDAGISHDIAGRNSYPDFRLVQSAEGFEIKGLAYPGREATYDANSQVPSGYHNDRTIFYVFGRYPKNPEGEDYPVIDLVVCHGDFLNTDRDYTHKNRSVRGFGSYGDILIRDRKMYVVPTPFSLLEGVQGLTTLILPEECVTDHRFRKIGELSRAEADTVLVAYKFDLVRNEITTECIPNLASGTVHNFVAYGSLHDSRKTDAVTMRGR